MPTTVWYTEQTSNPFFPSFSGYPGIQRADLSQLKNKNEYYWDGRERLYVYSQLDPADIVEIPARSSAVAAKGLTNVAFIDLDLRGSTLYGFYCGTTLPCSNLTFESDTFELNYARGLMVLSDYGVVDANGSIHNSIFKNNGGHGLQIGGDGPFANWIVSANEILNNCLIYNTSDALHQFCGGIYLDAARTQTGGANSVIEYNLVHDNGVLGNPMSSGQGIWIDTVHGVAIHHNVVWNSTSTGILLEKTLNSEAYNNVVYSSGVTKYTAALSVAGGQGFNSSHNAIFNNTLVGGWWTLANILEDTNGQNTYNSFTNNVSLGQNGGQAIYVADTATNNGVNSWGNSYTYNNFGIPFGGCYFNYGDVCISSHSAFEGAVGSATHDIVENPLFIDAQTGNFRLKSGSPNIRAGIRIVGYTGADPDIGAY